MIMNITKDSFILWFQKNFKALFAVCIVCLLAGLGAIAFISWENKQNEKTATALYTLQKSLKELVPEPQSKNQMLDRLTKKDKPLVLTDEMLVRAKAYEKSIKENEKFKTTAYFAIDLADFYYQARETKKAKEILSPFAKAEQKDILYHLASVQLAGYYMNDSDCSKALALFEKIISNPSAKPFHFESRLQRGICFEFMKKYKEALQEYKMLSVENPDSYLGRQAKDYERLLSLKQKLKKPNSN